MKSSLRRLITLLSAAVVTACSTAKAAVLTFRQSSGKPVVIVACGLGEIPGHSRMDPLIAALRQRGYDVRAYAYNELPMWYSERPVIAIGFSYGGDALCEASFSSRIDRLILLNPTRQGNVLCQGAPLVASDRVRSVENYITGDWLPRASSYVIRSSTNEFKPSSAVSFTAATIIKGAGHVGIIARVQEKIMNEFPCLP